MDPESHTTYQNFNWFSPCTDTRVNILLTPEITHCSIIILDNFSLQPPATIMFTLSADVLKGSNYFYNVSHSSLGIYLLFSEWHTLYYWNFTKSQGWKRELLSSNIVFIYWSRKICMRGNIFMKNIIYITKCFDIDLTTYFQQFKKMVHAITTTCAPPKKN